MKLKRIMALMLAAVLICTTPLAVLADDAALEFEDASGEAVSLPVESEEEAFDEIISDESYYDEPEMLTEDDYNYEDPDMLLDETAQSFSDVPPSDNYYKAIQWAADQGITEGYKDGTFRSGNTCTRGQIMMFIWRYMGKPEPTNLKQRFKDVPKSHGYFKAIQWAAEKGITGGYTDGRNNLVVNEPCTRGQIVTFIWRAKGKPTPKPQWENTLGKVQLFPDVPTTHNFYTAVLWAFTNNVAAGYTSGSKAGKFGLADACTRGQAVTFFYRMERKVIHSQTLKITSKTPFEIAAGLTTKIEYTTTPSNNNDAFVLKTDNTKVATVKPNGTIKGVKKGSTQVHVFSSSGLHVYTSVNVYANVCDSWNQSGSGNVVIQPIKAYYSGSDLIVEAKVKNNTAYKITKFSPITVEVLYGGSKQLAKRKWSTYTLNLSAYGQVTKKFTLTNAKLIDLTKNELKFSYSGSYYYQTS